MLSAKEANIRTATAIQEELDAEMSRIEKNILEASANGLYRCFIPDTLSPYMKEHLRKAGYKVDVYCQYNETETTISWEGECAD